MLTLRFGTGESLRGKIGAVELMGWLMSKGTLRLGNQELQDELTRLRAQLSLNSTLGLVQMTVKTKRKFVPEVIKLVGEVLREPRFDEDELEVIRSQVISSLQQEASNPQSLSPRAVRKKLAPYEKGDVRYVQSIDEEIAMYEKVTVEEIQQLHSNFLSSQAGEITGVGDFDAEEVKQLWKEQLQGWKTEQPYVRVGRDPHPEIAGSLENIETPDKANAMFYSSQQYALADTDPSYAPLVLGNFILGGGSLSSRLADRVRQQEGLSYGIRSGITPRAKDQRVDFYIYAITNPINKDRLIEVIREEVNKIREDGVTSEELEKAKTGYLQAARVRRTDDSALAGKLIGTILNERTLQQVADHEEQIKAATVEDVNQAIRSYIDPGKLIMAAAGDFAAAKMQAEQAETQEEAK